MLLLHRLGLDGRSLIGSLLLGHFSFSSDDLVNPCLGRLFKPDLVLV